MANINDLNNARLEVDDQGYVKVTPEGPNLGCLSLIIGSTIVAAIVVLIFNKVTGSSFDFGNFVGTSLGLGIVLAGVLYFNQ